jgi:hypothetical protein
MMNQLNPGKAYGEVLRRKLAEWEARQRAQKAGTAPNRSQTGRPAQNAQSNQGAEIDPLDMLAEQHLDHLVAEHVNNAVPGLGTALELLKTLSDEQTSPPIIDQQQAVDDQPQRKFQTRRSI